MIWRWQGYCPKFPVHSCGRRLDGARRTNELQRGFGCAASPSYLRAPANREATPAPPLDPTNWVSTGTNFAAIFGDRPNFLNGPATDAKPPKAPNPPGREFSRPERPLVGEVLDAAGADLIRLSIPGTLAATWLKSPGLRRLLANPNNAPAPPLACSGVMESVFVN